PGAQVPFHLTRKYRSRWPSIMSCFAPSSRFTSYWGSSGSSGSSAGLLRVGAPFRGVEVSALRDASRGVFLGVLLAFGGFAGLRLAVAAPPWEAGGVPRVWRARLNGITGVKPVGMGVASSYLEGGRDVLYVGAGARRVGVMS